MLQSPSMHLNGVKGTEKNDLFLIKTISNCKNDLHPSFGHLVHSGFATGQDCNSKNAQILSRYPNRKYPFSSP